ncbi:uncharacterized protein LOC128224413 [Mya arenaria]|uniref:uncharacterized protein LOC128224413 n=1 Tax=Mya arenaria TaxID=6604 RepID=UPI0022E596F8|nr:uncharacterized protein LOC128224413 [Mya arenaria]
MRESMMSMTFNMLEKDFIFFVAGSQREGTTTIGMDSDIDFFINSNELPVILDWSKWQHGKRNLLVVKHENTPPQHCWLQMTKSDIPMGEEDIDAPNLFDCEGRLLLMNNGSLDNTDLQKIFGSFERNGPELSLYNDVDIVKGFHCSESPKDCQVLFNRPRPGHWPKTNTIEKAKIAGVFLVPQCYKETPSNPTKDRSTALTAPSCLASGPSGLLEWRFSTLPIERFLVSDFNIVQLKVFTFMKLFRKEFIKPYFKDRLSTFHLKTAMFFTVESYPSDIWREDNIIQCVKYCFTTLLRWFKIKLCPHYTIANVNLFTGKLLKYELKILGDMLSAVISSHFHWLSILAIDKIGQRLSQISSDEQTIGTNHETNLSVLKKLFLQHGVEEVDDLLGITLNVDTNQRFFIYLQALSTLLTISEHRSSIEQKAASYLISNICSNVAIYLASTCIRQNQQISSHIINWFGYSLKTGLFSNKLKFASTLYCSGQYEQATLFLMLIEGELLERKLSLDTVIKTTSVSDILNIREYLVTDVDFTIHDILCVPKHLRYEQIKTEEDRDALDILGLLFRSNLVIDCIAFLYYLQYLTFMKLNNTVRMAEALEDLDNYVSENTGPFWEASLNVLGHCYELENDVQKAVDCYSESLDIAPTNNAAKWHRARLCRDFLHDD